MIVKRLASIHDLGAMTVLCTDKTGTLTSAEITLARSLDPDGGDDPAPRGSARSRPTGGDRGALDAALVAGMRRRRTGLDLRAAPCLRLHPPARLGARAAGRKATLLIVKGAPEAVLALCTSPAHGGGACAPWAQAERPQALARVHALAEAGLADASPSRRGHGPARRTTSRPTDEADLVFEGSAPSPIRPRRPPRRPSRGWRRPASG